LFDLGGQFFGLEQGLIAKLQAVRDRRIVRQFTFAKIAKRGAQFRASLEHLMQLIGYRRKIVPVASELQGVGLSALGLRQVRDFEAHLGARLIPGKFRLSRPRARARHNREDSERQSACQKQANYAWPVPH
jgi:hypothetical protein